tara:strand:+ start:3131 stop:4462 length:1332 start_codon:yes stop_codon:yes gene_type:complete
MIDFEHLSSAVASVQTTQSTKEKHSIIGVLLRVNKQQTEDIVALCCATPKDSLKDEQIIRLISKSYGLFPEEYESIGHEKELPLILADESPDEVERSLSLREARELKIKIIEGEDIHIETIFNSMSKISARVFWGFCYGRTLINYRKLMGGVSSVSTYSVERLQKARTIMPPHEVIQKALKGTLATDYAIQPSYPFIAPRYSRWPFWSLPFKETHYDVVKPSRYYAHRKAGRVFSFDRRGMAIARDPHLSIEGDCVAEIDENDLVVEWLHTNEDPRIWTKPRIDRCVNPRIVEDDTHLRRLVESLDADETLRLMDGERAYFHSGAVGGFIVPRRTFDLPLLILGGKRDGEGIRIKVAALDGFDLFPVGYCYVKEESIPDTLTPLFESNVYRECVEGLIGIFHALLFDTKTNQLRAPYLTRIDTTLGYSDAVQVGDLMERATHG